MARLDRLGEAREVAQIAAVIGRQFALTLARCGCPETRRRTRSRAGETRRGGNCLSGGARSGARASVSSTRWCATRLMRACCLARRREWHQRIARALEERFPEVTANEPELLAYHFGEAGLASPACDYRMRAGDRALSRSAYPGGDRAFLSGSQVGRSLAGIGRTDAPPTGFASEARTGVGDRAGHAERRGRTAPIAAPPRSAKPLDDAAAVYQGQMGPVAQRQSWVARRRWRASAPANC